MTFKLTANNRLLRLINYTEDEHDQLILYFKRKAKGYRYHPLYKRKIWSGDISFFDDRSMTLSIGLWKELYNMCKKYGFDLVVTGLSDYLGLKDFDPSEYIEWETEFYKDSEMKLRYYQTDTVVNFLKWKRSIAELATSAGKTLILFNLFAFLKAKGYLKGQFLVIVPNISLVLQTYEAFLKYSDYKKKLDFSIQTIGGGENVIDYNSDVIIGTFQTLRTFDSTILSRVSVVCADECLHPDTFITMADGTYKPIKDVIIGESVLTLNEKTKKIEENKVKEVYKNLSKDQKMFEIELEDGTSIKITGNHKVQLIDYSWKRADELTLEDEILSFDYAKAEETYEKIISETKGKRSGITHLQNFKTTIVKYNVYSVNEIEKINDNDIYERTYCKIFNIEPPKCITCGNPIKFGSFHDGYKNTVNNKNRIYCSKECIYNRNKDEFIETNKILLDPNYNDNYLSDNLNIYKFMVKHYKSFIHRVKFKDQTDRVLEWLDIYNKVKINFKFDTMEELYCKLLNFKSEDIPCCVICGKKLSFKDFVNGYYHGEKQTCSSKCSFKKSSIRMLNDNPNLKKTEEDKQRIAGNHSIYMKELILSGKFTPTITNSWCHSKISVDIYRNGILHKQTVRSSWEAFYQICNPNYLYEKIRIPYYNIENVKRNYIVDFIDEETKTLIEIKPDCNMDDQNNIIKGKAAEQWCIENGYTYKYINNDWFIENYNKEILLGQPEYELLIKRLRQFDKKKHQEIIHEN